MIVTIRDTKGNYRIIDSFNFYRNHEIFTNFLFGEMMGLVKYESKITSYKEYGSNYFAPSIKTEFLQKQVFK